MSQQSLFTSAEWDARRPLPATALTEAEALRLAQRLLGPGVYTFDRDAYKFSRENRTAAIRRFYVGSGAALYGNGDTWEQALDEAAKMARKAAKP